MYTRNCGREIIIYLAIVGECSYTVLETYTRCVIARNPMSWLMKAVEKGNLELLQHTVILGGLETLNWEWCMIRAAEYAHLHIIQYAASQILSGLSGISRYTKFTDIWNNCMTAAACEGHLHIIQYAIAQCVAARSAPIPRNWNGCIYWAAVGGHLHIIQYMNSISLESINWDTCMAGAALGGNLEIVQYVVSQETSGTLDWNWSIRQAKYNEKQNCEIIDFLEQCKSRASKSEN